MKTRFSAFFATHLHSLLQSNGINSVVVVGKWALPTNSLSSVMNFGLGCLDLELIANLQFYFVLNLFLWLGVQTPNCIRQTAFDAVSLDYQSVTVIVDATAAATPDIHLGMSFIPLTVICCTGINNNVAIGISPPCSLYVFLHFTFHILS